MKIAPTLGEPVTIEASVMAQIIMDICGQPPDRAGQAADAILDYLRTVLVGSGAAHDIDAPLGRMQ
jgi:hypothetical protein